MKLEDMVAAKEEATVLRARYDSAAAIARKYGLDFTYHEPGVVPRDIRERALRAGSRY